MTDLEALIAARELLTEQSRWCRGAFARSVGGVHVHPMSPQAVCWCAIGALIKVTRMEPGHNAKLFLSTVAIENFHTNATVVNDHNGWGDVLRLYDLAIERMKQNEQST